MPSRRPASDWDALQAPSVDGGILFFPQSSDIPRLVERNRRRRREFAARWWKDNPPLESATAEPPVIMTGHQPEFFHPGVWAKNVAASLLAARIGGRAAFLAVDSDAVGTPLIRWPERTEGDLSVGSLPPPNEMLGKAYETCPVISTDRWTEHLAAVPPEVRESADTPLAAFLDAFRGGRTSGQSPSDYIHRWWGGLAHIDHELGLPSPALMRVSGIETGPHGPHWWRFVADAILNAEKFAASYNAALADYRGRRNIRGSRHPIPDLAIDADRIELPFWLIGGRHARDRLYVARTSSSSIAMYVADRRLADVSRVKLATDPRSTLTAPLGSTHLRPRALALTLFARAFLCDLFIHGLGGAKYDQITDDWARRLCGDAPPEYACVTATMRLPLPRFDIPPDGRDRLRRRLRDYWYNPHRLLSADVPQAARLIADRSNEIAAAVALRDSDARNHAARRAAYDRLRLLNEQMRRLIAPTADPQRQFARLALQQAHNRIADNREWFVGLHHTAALRKLAHAITAAQNP